MQTVLRQLSAWRRRERLYRLAAGALYWLAVGLVAVAVACGIDWFADRVRDTPFWLRVLLSATQAVVLIVAAWWFVGRVRVPSVDALAAEAEGLIPAFGHRLVTAVQLNRSPAKAAGLSPHLLAQVTHEAGVVARQQPLARLADATPLSWAAAALLPVALMWAGFVAARPSLARALVERQMLRDVAIPRAVQLSNRTPAVLPAGDAVVVRVAASGPVADGTVGELRVEPDGGLVESFALKYESRDGDGNAVLMAELPPTGTPFAFRAYVGGGRLPAPARVLFAPRPAVTGVDAFVVLPRYVDPKGAREFRRHQPQGEVYALPDSSVDIAGEFSKAVTTAVVRFVRRDAAGAETILKEEALTLTDARTGGQVRAALPVGVTGYRIDATDEHGFTALYPPFRPVTVAPDRPPDVALLPEALKDPKEDGPLDDFLVDGMPLRLGGQVQVGYTAKSPVGIGRAFIAYRVNDGGWTPLPLTPVTADPAKVGKFVPELGVFTESGPFGQVELYQLPALDPDAEPDGLAAGGRFNFQTAALRKRPPGTSTDVPLEVGDAVEIRVAVYDRNPAPSRPPTRPPALSGQDAPGPVDARRPAGWSAESRIKQVVSDAKFEAWRQEHYRTRVKLADLEQKQRGVFERQGE